MLDKPAAKTAAVGAMMSLASFAFSRRYPQSRLLVALPVLHAGLSLLKAKQRADQVSGRQRGRTGLLERAKDLV